MKGALDCPIPRNLSAAWACRGARCVQSLYIVSIRNSTSAQQHAPRATAGVHADAAGAAAPAAMLSTWICHSHTSIYALVLSTLLARAVPCTAQAVPHQLLCHHSRWPAAGSGSSSPVIRALPWQRPEPWATPAACLSAYTKQQGLTMSASCRCEQQRMQRHLWRLCSSG